MQELSSSTYETKPSFNLRELEVLSEVTSVPLIRGRVVSGEHNPEGWSIECRSFIEFSRAATHLGSQLEILIYDESILDELTLQELGHELMKFGEDQQDGGFHQKAVEKAMAALRSHRHELFAVTAYGFLKSGRVLFIRHETELAAFVAWPDRLLSPEGLAMVRKLRTLEQ